MSAKALPSLQAQVLKIVVTLMATVAMVIGLGAFVLYAFNPVGDEWDCSPGEYPASYPEGGSYCVPNGEVPQDGATPDPGGNQPLGQ